MVAGKPLSCASTSGLLPSSEKSSMPTYLPSRFLAAIDKALAVRPWHTPISTIVPPKPYNPLQSGSSLSDTSSASKPYIPIPKTISFGQPKELDLPLNGRCSEERARFPQGRATTSTERRSASPGTNKCSEKGPAKLLSERKKIFIVFFQNF